MTDVEEIESLIQDLIASYTSKPDEIRLEAKELPGRVYWSVWASREDTPKIIGKAGAHSRPLQLIIREFGRSRGAGFDLKIEDPAAGPLDDRDLSLKTYDPELIISLIERVLEELGIGQFHVSHREREHEHVHHFELLVRTDEDLQTLMAGHQFNGPKRTVVHLTLAEALETLLRAGAARAATKVFLEVKKA